MVVDISDSGNITLVYGVISNNIIVFLVFRSDKIGPNQKSGDKMYRGEYDDLFLRFAFNVIL